MKTKPVSKTAQMHWRWADKMAAGCLTDRAGQLIRQRDRGCPVRTGAAFLAPRSMSPLVSKRVICSRCNSPVAAEVYESVNITNEPSLRERVLKRAINTATCPKCGLQMLVATNFLYHDMRLGFMVWLKLNEALEHSTEHPALAAVSGRMFSSYRLRVVNSWPELIERIRILESGLDEGLLEIIKYMIWGHLPGHEPGSYAGDGLYFWYADPMEIPEPVVAFQLEHFN